MDFNEPGPYTDGWMWEWISEFIDIKEVVKNPKLPWSRKGLSKNKGITIDITHLIDKNPETIYPGNETNKWSQTGLSRNLPIDDILKYPNYDWDDVSLSMNKNLTVEAIARMPHIKWEWHLISQYINCNEVETSTYQTWDRYGLSLNNTIKSEMFSKRFIMPNAIGKWDWDFISASISKKEIYRNPWILEHLNIKIEENPDVEMWMIDQKGLRDQLTRWDLLSQNLPIEDIINNPQLPWDLTYLSLNRHADLNKLKNFKMSKSKGKWSWVNASQVINMAYIRKNSKSQWSKFGLSRNPGITVNDIKSL